ncbi:MAG: HD-GYP domain-containing protein [Spirochaetaceae bacterium]|jgi:HD-GYP domain-containing protein (c-di-GMP phosphodiesterase class II)|nr:HD-GYP domain-containing protein [Spirochaetaceae bacterium]
MKGYAIKDIQPDSYFSKPVYLSEGFILAAPETPFTREIIKVLLDWEFREVYSDGEPRDVYFSDDVDEADEILGQGMDASVMSDTEHINRAGEFLSRFQIYVEKLFTKIAMNEDFYFNDVAEEIKKVVEFVRADRRFLFRTEKMALPASEANYLSSHTVKSTIISLVIGIQLKLPVHRLIELGVAALLHEVGMLKLPPQTYLSKRPLSPQERKAIISHPVLSFNILKAANFPLVISLAGLEHHERENGSGYPQKLTADKISYYAKIIAVACSYEAQTSSRPHKTPKDGYSGMLDLLKNEGKQYDDTIVRALVFSLSIYPIGLYVLLSNGKKAQVVDVNPENALAPVVQIFGELTPDGKNRALQTDKNGVYIVRPLNREEIPSQ